MRSIAESNLAEVRDIGAAHFDSGDGLEAMTRHQLVERMRRGEGRNVKTIERGPFELA